MAINRYFVGDANGLSPKNTPYWEEVKKHKRGEKLSSSSGLLCSQSTQLFKLPSKVSDNHNNLLIELPEEIAKQDGVVVKSGSIILSAAIISVCVYFGRSLQLHTRVPMLNGNENKKTETKRQRSEKYEESERKKTTKLAQWKRRDCAHINTRLAITVKISQIEDEKRTNAMQCTAAMARKRCEYICERESIEQIENNARFSLMGNLSFSLLLFWLFFFPFLGSAPVSFLFTFLRIWVVDAFFFFASCACGLAFCCLVQLVFSSSSSSFILSVPFFCGLFDKTCKRTHINPFNSIDSGNLISPVDVDIRLRIRARVYVFTINHTIYIEYENVLFVSHYCYFFHTFSHSSECEGKKYRSTTENTIVSSAMCHLLAGCCCVLVIIKVTTITPLNTHKQPSHGYESIIRWGYWIKNNATKRVIDLIKLFVAVGRMLRTKERKGHGTERTNVINNTANGSNWMKLFLSFSIYLFICVLFLIREHERARVCVFVSFLFPMYRINFNLWKEVLLLRN